MTGSLLLGGFDSKKYKSLTKIRTTKLAAERKHVPLRSFLTNFELTMPDRSSIEIHPTVWMGNHSDGLPVLFDTGAPMNLLPNALYFAIGNIYPGAVPYASPNGNPAFEVPCAAPTGSFDYTFGNTTVKVSFQDSVHKDRETGKCNFGFSLGPQDSGTIPFILGASIMRGAYMVFDNENSEVWMGEKADCGSNVVPLGKPNDTVPVVPGCGSGGGDGTKPTTTSVYAPPKMTIF